MFELPYTRKIPPKERALERYMKRYLIEQEIEELETLGCQSLPVYSRLLKAREAYVITRRHERLSGICPVGKPGRSVAQGQPVSGVSGVSRVSDSDSDSAGSSDGEEPAESGDATVKSDPAVAPNFQGFLRRISASHSHVGRSFLDALKGAETLPRHYAPPRLGSKLRLRTPLSYTERHLLILNQILHLSLMRDEIPLAYKAFGMLIRTATTVNADNLWPLGLEILSCMRENATEAAAPQLLSEYALRTFPESHSNISPSASAAPQDEELLRYLIVTRPAPARFVPPSFLYTSRLRARPVRLSRRHNAFHYVPQLVIARFSRGDIDETERLIDDYIVVHPFSEDPLLRSVAAYACLYRINEQFAVLADGGSLLASEPSPEIVQRVFNLFCKALGYFWDVLRLGGALPISGVNAELEFVYDFLRHCDFPFEEHREELKAAVAAKKVAWEEVEEAGKLLFQVLRLTPISGLRDEAQQMEVFVDSDGESSDGTAETAETPETAETSETTETSETAAAEKAAEKAQKAADAAYAEETAALLADVVQAAAAKLRSSLRDDELTLGKQYGPLVPQPTAPTPQRLASSPPRRPASAPTPGEHISMRVRPYSAAEARQTSEMAQRFQNISLQDTLPAAPQLQPQLQPTPQLTPQPLPRPTRVYASSARRRADQQRHAAVKAAEAATQSISARTRGKSADSSSPRRAGGSAPHTEVGLIYDKAVIDDVFRDIDASLRFEVAYSSSEEDGPFPPATPTRKKPRGG